MNSVIDPRLVEIASVERTASYSMTFSSKSSAQLYSFKRPSKVPMVDVQNE